MYGAGSYIARWGVPVLNISKLVEFELGAYVLGNDGELVYVCEEPIHP